MEHLSKEVIIKNQIEGIDVIVDIDWQGTRQIEKHLGQKTLLKYLYLPPSIYELRNLDLGNRASENKENFQKRMSEAKKKLVIIKNMTLL